MALIVLTLANCDNSRVKPVDDNVNQDPIARLLEQANNLPSPQSEQLMLQAVAQLRENNRVKEAERILNAIDANLLPGSIKADFILETARFSRINQDTALAHRLLATDQMQ